MSTHVLTSDPQLQCARCSHVMQGNGHFEAHIRNKKKKSPKRKFSGRMSSRCPRIIRAEVPGQELRVGCRKFANLGKTSICPKVRTSMTLRGCQETSGRKTSGCDFSFPVIPSKWPLSLHHRKSCFSKQLFFGRRSDNAGPLMRVPLLALGGRYNICVEYTERQCPYDIIELMHGKGHRCV